MSRRLVQRRFPPGSFAIRGPFTWLVIGWAPVPPHPTGWKNHMTARDWECLLVRDQRLERVRWETMRECYTLDEWEAPE
jgi:hypothetical protein